MVILMGNFYFLRNALQTQMLTCARAARTHLYFPVLKTILKRWNTKLSPIKYDKACLTLLAVPSKNSHVISHCIDYICVLCATILEKGARSAKSLKMTLEVRRAPAASFSRQVHPRVKKTRLEENMTPPPFFTKRKRRRLPWPRKLPKPWLLWPARGIF